MLKSFCSVLWAMGWLLDSAKGWANLRREQCLSQDRTGLALSQRNCDCCRNDPTQTPTASLHTSSSSQESRFPILLQKEAEMKVLRLIGQKYSPHGLPQLHLIAKCVPVWMVFRGSSHEKELWALQDYPTLTSVGLCPWQWMQTWKWAKAWHHTLTCHRTLVQVTSPFRCPHFKKLEQNWGIVQRDTSTDCKYGYTN